MQKTTTTTDNFNLSIGVVESVMGHIVQIIVKIIGYVNKSHIN